MIISCEGPHDETVRADGSVILDTTLGQALFNEVLPDDYPYVDFLVGKKQIGKIVNDLSERMTQLEVAHVLDNLKDIGYKWGSLSGVTVSIAAVASVQIWIRS
jgi:DNA-directed RNA polymerase subunit beta'